MSTETKDKFQVPRMPRIHPAAKIVVGAGVLGLLWWKAPVIEAVKAFFWLCLIPLALLSAIGLIGSGTLEWIGGKNEAFFKDLSEKVNQERENLKRDPPQEAEEVRPAPTPA